MDGFVDLSEERFGRLAWGLGEAAGVVDRVDLFIGQLTGDRADLAHVGEQALEEMLQRDDSERRHAPRQRREALDHVGRGSDGAFKDGNQQLIERIDGAQGEVGTEALAFLLGEEGLGGFHDPVVQLAVAVEALLYDADEASRRLRS